MVRKGLYEEVTYKQRPERSQGAHCKENILGRAKVGQWSREFNKEQHIYKELGFILTEFHSGKLQNFFYGLRHHSAIVCRGQTEVGTQLKAGRCFGRLLQYCRWEMTIV